MKKAISIREKTKWAILIVICCISLSISAFAESTTSQNTKPLLFLGNQNLAPMVYIENDLPKGIIVDITAALGEKMGRTIDIKAINWADAQKIVEQGGADALIQINATEERKKIFDFSEPLLESKFSIFTLTGRTGISGVIDLRGLRVGVETKGFPSVVLQTDPLIQLVNTSNILEAFNMLKEGDVDVVVADEWVGTYILAKNKINGVLIVGDSIAKLESAIAVKKGNLELLAAIDKGLQEMKKDGTYQRILEKWKPEEVVFQTLDQIKLKQYEMAFVALGVVLIIAIVCGLLLFHQLSKIKRMKQMLTESHRRLSDVITGTNVGTWEWNVQTGEMIFNERWAEMIGYTLNEISPTSFETCVKFVHPEDLEKANEQLDRIFAKELDYYEIAYRIKHKDGSWIWIEDRGNVTTWDNDGKPLLMSGTHTDITKSKNEEEKNIYLSYHDLLTGVYNRRFYEEELRRLDTERNLPLTIAMGDLNGLKLVNDSFGHHMGDKFLEKVAELIKEACRADDIVSRVGGDEFVIILPKTDGKEAKEIINRIYKSVSEKRVENLKISISFGYETKTEMGQKIGNVFKEAEDHMYCHKLYEDNSIKSQMIDLIMNTLHEKNPRELSHSKRVSGTCEMIAKGMNLSDADIKMIRVAGLMHDIGKIGIDEKVLNSMGKLNDEEWKEMKKHPEISYRILGSAKEFSEIAIFALDHHERWDGSGYPKGLKGEEISLPARIIAIADSFDAMTGERPYRKSLSEEDAIKEIIKCSGTQFDPSIVEIFVKQFSKEL